MTTLGALSCGDMFMLYPKYRDGSRRPQYRSVHRNHSAFNFSSEITVLDQAAEYTAVSDAAGTVALLHHSMRIKETAP